MNLTRCENGHFYDAERFSTCPHCNQPSISTVLPNTQGDTMPLNNDGGNGLDKLVEQAKEEDGAKTVGYFGEVANEPVVG